jgi:hypothetical protein
VTEEDVTGAVGATGNRDDALGADGSRVGSGFCPVFDEGFDTLAADVAALIPGALVAPAQTSFAGMSPTTALPWWRRPTIGC